MLKKIVLFFLFLIQMQLIHANFSMGATRIVYNEGNKGVPLSITNKSSADIYLIQSWVNDADSLEKSSDFLVTPPLSRLDESQENLLKIVFIGNKDNLPKDRESVYFLNVKAIPNEDPNIQNRLSFAFNNKIKLFYRPKNLTIPVEEAAKKINFNYENSKLTVNNPTPYYITFESIEADGKKLLSEPIMIAPLNSIEIPVNANLSNSKMVWRTINDYGAIVTDEKK